VTADLAARPFEASDVSWQSSWLLRRLEMALGSLVRLTEAPEYLLPMGAGMPYEARYRALAVTLVRLYQLYTALRELHQQEEASARFWAVAALVRLHITGAAA
jgi:hypothetical protein